MSALLFAFFAACFASLSNLFFRKHSEVSTSASGLLTVHYGVSFLLSCCICSDLFFTPFSLPLFSVGASVGLLNVALMFFIYRALKTGPSGLTFALQNASAVVPGLLLFLLFGREFGFDFSRNQALGIGLVLFGFFLASRYNNEKGQRPLSWIFLKFALCSFFIQALALTLMQSRTVFISLFFSQNNSDVWFLPGLFAVAFCIQLAQLLYEKRRIKLLRSEILFGCASGLLNGLSTYLLSIATKVAAPCDTAILFPLFAVSVIILCQLWSSKFYGEKCNFFSNATSCAGVILAL